MIKGECIYLYKMLDKLDLDVDTLNKLKQPNQLNVFGISSQQMGAPNIPKGNEAVAFDNDNWRPGGYTLSGLSEAALDMTSDALKIDNLERVFPLP